MSLDNLKELLELYDLKYKEWAKKRGKYLESRNIINEFYERASVIPEIEDKILSYFNETIEKKIW